MVASLGDPYTEFLWPSQVCVLHPLPVLVMSPAPSTSHSAPQISLPHPDSGPVTSPAARTLIINSCRTQDIDVHTHWLREALHQGEQIKLNM